MANAWPRGQGYRMRICSLSIEPSDRRAAHDAALINRALEQLIRELPEQYLWGYNRYKVPAGAQPPPRGRGVKRLLAAALASS